MTSFIASDDYITVSCGFSAEASGEKIRPVTAQQRQKEREEKRRKKLERVQEKKRKEKKKGW